MPPMPPIPPPGGILGWPLGSGLSATIASVVINSPATEAASCSATRTTLVGSIIPAATMSLYSPDCASKPKFGSPLSVSLPTTTEPSTPEFSAIWRTGDWMALRTIPMPTFWSLFAGLRPSRTLLAKSSATPPPATNTFLDRGLGCVHAILDAVFALLHLDLAAAADTDHRDAARKLGQPLLQLLAVIIRCRLFDLRPDLVGAG